jgi:dynactin 6
VIEGTARIGDYVLIEAGCQISAVEIGDDCVIENAVVLGEGCVVGAGCRICAGEIIEAGQVVPAGTIVFSNGRRRTDNTEQVPRTRRPIC